MTDIKYTSDGKKVLVVGKLNAEQTIVQEIFVSAGQEIPSGENFVVKSLHDAPAESWKEKNLRELEARYERSRKELESSIDQQARRLTMIKDKAKHHADALFKFVENSESDQLDLLKKVLSGQITHVFISGYSPEIFEWEEGSKAYDIDTYHGRMQVDGIKLLSVYGYSDGNLTYRLHSYRDGSGGSDQVFPVCSYAEALTLAQAECDKQAASYLADKRSSFHLSSWQKIEGIVIPEAAIQKCDAEADAQRVKRIANLKKELADLEEKAPAKAKPAK
ncbi:hypothetical protein [Pseudomonas sp. B15(2017)]|uniref:hypothetical protein n=1 Tax=Pseudomonas sp. B15(2017) TaxID=1981744 RepID=UPI000A200DA7|nr:hypothetical protein [Pseudomonas sp. B15(2017)]